jgi:hypothetical protein
LDTTILAGQVITHDPAPQFDPVIVISSIQTPTPLTLLSVARLHLRTIFCPLAVAGRFTVDVKKPPENPDQAGWPEMGLPKNVLIVCV